MRCFPVKTSPKMSKEEMIQEALHFFYDKMGVEQCELGAEHIEEVRRVSAGRRKTNIKDEVIVIFTNIAMRDMVSTYAANLGEWRKENDRDDIVVGIRLEIPDHLSGVFRVLDRHGHQLRDEHGRGLKRRIKYDDVERTLVLDARLPGEDMDWHRIDYATALRKTKGGRFSSTSSMDGVSNSQPGTSAAGSHL